MPIKSRYTDVQVPNVDIWTFLFERAELPYNPDRTIFHDAGSSRSYSFNQLREACISFGEALRDAWSWRKDDVLAVISPNDVDWPAVVFGCHWAGGIVTTANPIYTADELVGQLRDSGAKAIVAHPMVLEKALKVAETVGIPSHRILLMGPRPKDSGGVQYFKELDGSRFDVPYQRQPRPFKIDPKKDLSFLVYSSGTTGKAKGVMLTHSNLVTNSIQMSAVNTANLRTDDDPQAINNRTVGFLPFFHIYGLNVLLHAPIYSGHEVFVLPAFDLKTFCSLVHQKKITYNFVIPRVLLLLAKDPSVDKYDFGSIKMFISGAAPLTKELAEMVYQRLKTPVTQAYGMSETSPGTHAVPRDEWRDGVGSIGRPIPNQEAMIMDIDGKKECGVGEEGELWIRGPNVFSGYLNNNEATKNALTSDGWYKTGDVAYVDKNGFFFITDRVKELIKYNGFQVAPAELEGLLVSHPKVKDAAVIGLFYADQATELPRAYIVPEEGVKRDQATAEEIANWMKEKTAKHKWLRGGVRFIDIIPASATGKILRRELKAAAEKEQKTGQAKL